MKKEMIKFLATSMTAFTLMGTAVAFAPAKQVFAAEAETATETSEGTRELKTMSVVEADAYLKELVGNKNPYQEYDYTKMYRVGNKVYSISTFVQEPEIIDKKIANYQEAKQYYRECCARGMIDGAFEYYWSSFAGASIFDHARITGKIPTVNLSIGTYTIKPVESATITADKTMIHTGETAYLSMQVNEGADESSVRWRAIGTDGVADFGSLGTEAFVAGYAPGTVMVVAETDEGIKDYIHISIVD